MGFLNYEGLQHFYGKILSRFKTINTQLSEITTTLGGKSDSNHTHNYAGSSSPGGSATSAVKLDTSAGSETNPVYFKDGKPVKTTYSLGKSVPSDAKFTDTTYNEATTSVAGLMSATDKSNLNGVTSNIQTQLDGKVPTSRTVNGKALTGNISLTYSDVGADASGSANTALTNAKSYTDTKISALINGAPSTLDTLKEIADAMAENEDVVKALETSIGTKANASDLTSHTGNTTVHITSTERTNWNDANSKKHTHSNSSVLNATTASYTTALNTKLDGIATGAEVNQNAFSNVTVGSTTIAADSKTDTLTLAAGSNITLTPDATNDKITITATDTVYTHPSYTAKSSGFYKVTVDATGHVSAVANVTKSDITGLGIPSSDTTYSAATTSAAGLMSAADKSKLDGIASGANAYTHPNSGVTAGTYRSVTVNAAGHVTAGSNPTIAVNQGGTGATDAATARTNLGLGTAATYNITIDRNTTGTLLPTEIVVSDLAGKLSRSGGVMEANTNYTTNQVRNTVFVTDDPGANVSSTYANGSIIAVYE